jgi:hypothetical protein
MEGLAAEDPRRCATDGVEERVEVRFAGAEIDDARPEHESSLELSASQKHTPLVLHGVEDVPVQSIDIGALSVGRGPMTEAGDAERPGGDELEIRRVAQTLRQRTSHRDVM